MLQVAARIDGENACSCHGKTGIEPSGIEISPSKEGIGDQTGKHRS